MNPTEIKQIMETNGLAGVIVRNNGITVWCDQPTELQELTGEALKSDGTNIELFECEHSGVITQGDYDKITARFSDDYEILTV